MEKKSRELVQKESLEVFKASPTHRGTICLSTGTGKSKVAIDFIKNVNVTFVLITSPRTNLKDNWEKELQKWGLEIDHNRSDRRWKITGTDRYVWIDIENIQTAYKWKDKKFDLIVADEIHTMMTPEYSLLFENNDYTYLMGLTATHDITSKNDKEWYYKKYCPIIYEYYDSADDGLINKTRFVVVNHSLNDADKITVRYKNTEFQKGEADHYNYLTELITQGQKLMMQQGSDNWFRDAGKWFWQGKEDRELIKKMFGPNLTDSEMKEKLRLQKLAAIKYLNAINYRKDYLLNLPSSAKIAKKIKEGILANVPDSKVLIFSELTDQVEQITSNTTHSHKSKVINASLLVDFNKGRIRDLGSCQSLTLGLNLKGATHAIMESYIGSATKSKQKKGRLDRLAVDDVAELWIIRIVGTQSESWFKEMIKGFDLTNAEYVDSSMILNDQYDYAKK